MVFKGKWDEIRKSDKKRGKEWETRVEVEKEVREGVRKEEETIVFLTQNEREEGGRGVGG